MSVKFKVRDKGVWIYEEREFCLEVPLILAPEDLEQILYLVGGLLKSKLQGGFLSQVAGNRNADGGLLSLRMSQDLLQGQEPLNIDYSVSTKFFSYKDLSVLSSIREEDRVRLIKGLTSDQIVRQVGLAFESLEIGIKFYSSKSHISKWFKVPMEEGSLSINIFDSRLKCRANLRKNCDERNLKFIKEVLSLLAEIAEVDIHELDSYWDFKRALV